MNIIAIDIGTSRIKAALFDESGAMSCLDSCRLDRASSPVTQNAEEWFCVTSSLLRKITRQYGSRVDAVVLTGNMHALLGIDSDGAPVADAVLWSDNSAAAESDSLNKLCGKELITLCGNASTPVFTLPKIIRMKRMFPELYAKSETFMQSKDYIAFRLTGKRITDPTDASGVLGMDLKSFQWKKELFDELEIDINKLPEIVPSASVCGYVTAQAAEFTGVPAGTPVVTGTGDLSSAAVGSGVNDDTISLTLGTAGQLLATGKRSNSASLAGKLFVFAHADPERELYLGSVPAGGFSYEWFSKMHNISMPEFFKLAESVPLKEDLPVFMPYILGRGAPYMQYTPSGAWFRLNASHTPGDMCRGAVFGALSPLRQCADLLEELAGSRKNIVLQALACREKPVRETVCALFTQEKFIPENSEASLLGAAIVGATAMQCYSDINTASQKMITNTPLNTKTQETAQKLFSEFMKYADFMQSL